MLAAKPGMAGVRPASKWKGQNCNKAKSQTSLKLCAEKTVHFILTYCTDYRPPTTFSPDTGYILLTFDTKGKGLCLCSWNLTRKHVHDDTFIQNILPVLSGFSA